MFGTANFSPNCGENGSNSEEKSSRMIPVKCAATWVELNTQNLAKGAVWSSSVTSLRSHRLRVEPAKGATSIDCGNKLMKSGTIRDRPTHAKNDSTLPVSPSCLGKTTLPRSVVGCVGLLGL